jgi:hypothetical protein
MLLTFAMLISPATPRAFDVAAFLAGFAPGTAHEAIPHGVPQSYDWQSRAIGGTPAQPAAEATMMNLWGQVYVDTSNIHAPNTRAEVKNSQLWVLYSSQSKWELGYKTNDLGGGAWTEDFTSSGGAFDMKTEPDSGRSFVPANGYNSHFWPNRSFLPIETIPPRALIAVAHTRLVSANPAAGDDRSTSAYIIGMGADWRKPDGSCPNNICTGFGVGKFITPTALWRAVVMSTMSSTDLASLPMPPDSIFLLPDGKYPDGTGETSTIRRSFTSGRVSIGIADKKILLYDIRGARICFEQLNARHGMSVALTPGTSGLNNMSCRGLLPFGTARGQ